MDPRQHPFQPLSLVPQHDQRGTDASGLSLHLIATHYLTTKDAAQHYGYRAVSGLREWALGRGIRPVRRGRLLLWDVRDLDRELARSRFHVPTVAQRSA